jgi:hypothetical protein
LFDCHGLDFKSDNLVYSKIHHEYLCWLSEKFKLENSTIKIRSNYLKQFLQWYKETHAHQAAFAKDQPLGQWRQVVQELYDIKLKL